MKENIKRIGNLNITHEDDFKYNAPHHYIALNSEDELKVIQEIDFQEGPIKEVGVNGITEEVLLNIIRERFMYFQKSEYACEENEKCITYLSLVLQILEDRKQKRLKRNVEGTSQV